MYITRPNNLFSLTKTITNCQKANWTSFEHFEDFTSYQPHSTNVHEINKHLIKTIFNVDKLFIPKENHKSINCIHLPMHICKLIHHCYHVHKQNRSDPQIFTLNNHIHTKNTLTKLITNTYSYLLLGTIAKPYNKKPPT